MRISTTLTAFAALLAGVEAAIKGFNIGANNEDGSCKTVAQWENAFRKLKNLPHHYRQVRLYASSDCNTLANAVPAAQKTGTKLLVGVWAQDDAHYAAEKAALTAAIQQHGHKWILAVSVGSEDLYRNDNPPARLAGQIREVRQMVRKMGVKKPVMHVDTWTAWVNPANNEVIKACDVIGMNGFPYWQGSTADQAEEVFFKSLTDTRNAVHSVGGKKAVWVTETSQPTKGADFGASHPSISSARRYFKEVACRLYRENVPTFWYSYQDYNASPSFGLFGRNGKPLYKTTC